MTKYSKLDRIAEVDELSLEEYPLVLVPVKSWKSWHWLGYGVLISANIILASLLMEKRHDTGFVRKPLLTFCMTSNPPEETGLTTTAGPAEAGLISYHRQRLKRPLDDNPFTGDPRPERDAAYSHILEPMTVRITNDEYEKYDLGTSTLKLADGSGYIGEMSLYHELHCIKRIRQHLNLELYYPNLTGNDLWRENVHTGELFVG